MASLLVMLTVAAVPLGGCGQKGALYLPGPDGKPLRPPGASAASAPITAAAPASAASTAPTSAPSNPTP